MFKVGDRVKVIGSGSYGAMYHFNKTVIIREANIIRYGNPPYCLLDCQHHNGCGVWNSEIKLAKLEPKTETEFLDAFKYNFEDGG